MPPAVADYAIIALAAVGDDRAWPTAHTKLRRQLDRPPPTFQPRQITPGLKLFHAILTTAYLVRHLNNAPDQRIRRLVAIVRTRFDRLHNAEQDWLTEHWPGIAPDGPHPDQIIPPDPAPFQALAYATHLFGPIY